jgi:hypothetical protein
LIKFEIDKFRDYIKNKKDKIRIQKTIVEKMIREEEDLDDMFISEITQEMDKREKEDGGVNKKKEESLNNKFGNVDREDKKI